MWVWEQDHGPEDVTDAETSVGESSQPRQHSPPLSEVRGGGEVGWGLSIVFSEVEVIVVCQSWSQW